MSKTLIHAVLESEDRYGRLSDSTDIVNALYTYGQENRVTGIMQDLCEALEIDGYYRLIDDAFALTSFNSPLSVYQLRLRLKLAAITTLSAEWETAYDWALSAHTRSKNGLEYFKLQQFRRDLLSVTLFCNEAKLLISELFNFSAVDSGYMKYLHSRIGYMPTYFSMRTRLLYANGILLKFYGYERAALERYALTAREAEEFCNR